VAEVTVDRVTKRFGDAEANRDISLTVPNGEFVVLLGPTGAGKTTLLRLIAGWKAGCRKHLCSRTRRHGRPAGATQRVGLFPAVLSVSASHRVR